MARTAAGSDILSQAGLTMSVPEYAELVGISRDSAYRLAVRDELGVRVLRLGRRMRIPTADVRRLLGEVGADLGGDPASTPGVSGRDAAVRVPCGTPSRALRSGPADPVGAA